MPTVQPAENNQSNNYTIVHDDKRDERGTDQAPLVIKTSAEDNAKATKEREEDAKEKAKADWWAVAIGIATIAIGFITLIVLAIQARVFWVQAERLRDSVEEMKTTTTATREVAAAAKATADALKAIDRPWVLMDVFALVGMWHKPHGEANYVPGIEHPQVRYSWKNAGRSPAFLLSMDVKFFLLEPGEELPNRWDTSFATPLDHEHPMIDGGIYRAPVFLSVGAINQATWISIANGEKKLIFRAFVRYKDSFGDEHESRFCAWFSGLPDNTDYYNNAGGHEYNSQT